MWKLVKQQKNCNRIFSIVSSSFRAFPLDDSRQLVFPQDSIHKSEFCACIECRLLCQIGSLLAPHLLLLLFRCHILMNEDDRTGKKVHSTKSLHGDFLLMLKIARVEQHRKCQEWNSAKTFEQKMKK